jgi:hypothetical protein
MKGANSYDSAKVGAYVRRWEALEERAAAEKRDISQVLKEDKEALLDEAGRDGLPRDVLKTFFASITGIRKIAARTDKMDLDGQARIAMLLDAAKVALGPLFDTPLGQFAVAAIEADRPKEGEHGAAAPASEQPKKGRKTREERLAELQEKAKTVPWGPQPKKSRKAAAAGDPSPQQTDLEQAAREATARDEAAAADDPELGRHFDRTTNERVAEAAAGAEDDAPWLDDREIAERAAEPEAA